MDFSAWQESKKFESIEEFTFNPDDVGYIYDDGSFIQILQDGGQYDGFFWSCAGNGEVLTLILEDAEKWLWENWAKDNYAVTKN